MFLVLGHGVATGSLFIGLGVSLAAKTWTRRRAGRATHDTTGVPALETGRRPEPGHGPGRREAPSDLGSRQHGGQPLQTV